ncbi:vegetative cell wall protein gp1-like [Anarrhichthys ocellatus]|uniref:vegetative cell wall protein gp1-like n=1 Tax=Anarrhichthys ocellatus TaxID=433405 RepID=UPI0012ECD087|nr:vegetative cell wall protein gp1-like [Anarrhichthys ocellatus]
MDNRDLYHSPLDMALTLCSAIYQIAVNAKANKRNCQQLAQRVKVLEGLVLTFKKKEQDGFSPTVENALKDLCSTLKSAKKLMKKLSQNNALRGLMKSDKDEDHFSNVDERLIDNFQVLSGVFLIDHGNDPSSMPPMAYNTTTTMSQPMNMAPMGYNPTASMPQPSSMTPRMYDPTASMPQPISMTPMMYDPTASMPQSSSMPPMMYDPTASMRQPSSIPPMMYNPTASMPQPSGMPPFMYNTTAPMPQPSNMPTYSPLTPYPSQSPMPTMAMSNSIRPLSSVPFPNSSMGMMAPMSLSTPTTSVPNYGFLP